MKLDPKSALNTLKFYDYLIQDAHLQNTLTNLLL